jgi:peptidoglycan hydrolase-like protein with peptidoglycan-binding domain
MQVSNSEVRNIQQKLDKEGYHSGREDGIIGPETTAALRGFQKKKGLQVTGQVDQQTLQAMGVSTAAKNGPGYGSSNKGTSAQGAPGQGQPGASKGD